MFDDLTPCEICGGLGLVAKDIWNKSEFVHKIPSPNFVGYFTFTAEHQN